VWVEALSMITILGLEVFLAANLSKQATTTSVSTVPSKQNDSKSLSGVKKPRTFRRLLL